MPYVKEPAVGTRLIVYSADLQQDLGTGTYQGEVLMRKLDPRHVDSSFKRPDRTEVIRLATGKVIYGFQCLWLELVAVETPGYIEPASA
jgi:hypothetical protein